VKKLSQKEAIPRIAGTLLTFALALSGCAHSGNLHPFLSQRGLLMPLQNPDGLVRNADSLTLFLGDSFNQRKEGGQVLFGHRLTDKLRKQMGGQVAEACRTLPCYAHAAKAWKRPFILSASIQKNDDASKPEGVLTITRWSTEPLFPKVTVTVPFLLDSSRSSYEKIIEKGIDRLISRISETQMSESSQKIEDSSLPLEDLLANGDLDRALRLGERIYEHPAGHRLSKNFYDTLYSLEENAGKLDMAKKIGNSAIESGLASKALLLKMAGNARDLGDHNREHNILFRGLALYPNDREFWRYLVRERIREGEYQKAMSMIQQFDKRNPPLPNRPHFAVEIYAILVGTGKGFEADQWFKSRIDKNWADASRPSAFLAHAVVTRYFQNGAWKKAADILGSLIGRGVQSEALYRDWMTALGAENDPIGEVHVGREAIARGFQSRWIKAQVAFLEQKGY